MAHQFGKNNFVRQNEVGFKGDSRLKNQKTQEVSGLRLQKQVHLLRCLQGGAWDNAQRLDKGEFVGGKEKPKG